uniref:ATP-dependent DNA helicase n=1 Tax=Lactuca sativa TaxID=4236 RepID=A0A9R1V5E6_LACSA|nr:hypothetical protein LSAT_V11C700382800 [Lactuca sativa]
MDNNYLLDKKSCDIKKPIFLGDLLQRTSLIIWDEALMSERRCFKILDRSLRDVLDCDDQLFGGISFLLGDIIALTLPSSYLWPFFTIHILRTNMRVHSSEITTNGLMSASDFATWLLCIGDGLIGVPDKDDPRDSSWLEIPYSLLITPGADSLKTLIDFLYGDGTLNNPTAIELSIRAIVSPTNDVVDDINIHILRMDMIQPNGKHTSDLEGLYPIEYLNQLNFAEIPAYELTLKIHYPIMLLKNINQREGLCNDTRLIVSQLLPNVIEATIITGTCIGKRAYIPCIKFIHKSSDMPFTFSRKQFPLKVCYAMTINKSQGQFLCRIG